MRRRRSRHPTERHDGSHGRHSVRLVSTSPKTRCPSPHPVAEKRSELEAALNAELAVHGSNLVRDGPGRRRSCDRDVPVTGVYWVSGAETNTSDRFQLQPRPKTKLHVSGGNKNRAQAGAIFAILGGLIILMPGLITAAIAAGQPSDPNSSSKGALWAGAVALNGGGLALGVFGLVWWISNSPSSVEASAKNHGAPRRAAWIGGL